MFLKLGSGGLCPFLRKSLSWSHWGRLENPTTFHDWNLCHTFSANSSAYKGTRDR